jgi:hypothetical protein
MIAVHPDSRGGSGFQENSLDILYLLIFLWILAIKNGK